MTPANWLRLALLALIWGATFPLIEVAGPHMPALTLVWLRVGIASAALAAVLSATGTAFPARRLWPALILMGALNNALPFTLITLAQGRIAGSEAAILNATTPLFTLIVAALAGQDRLTLPRLAGLAAGIAGVAVLTGTAPGAEAAAMALCLGAALSYALAGVWGCGRLGALDPMAAAFGMLASAALILMPAMAVYDRPWTLPTPPVSAWSAVAVLALAGSAFAYRLYFRLLADVGAVNLLLVTFLVPVSAIGISVAALGEVILPRHALGLALILAGLALASGRGTAHAAGKAGKTN